MPRFLPLVTLCLACALPGCASKKKLRSQEAELSALKAQLAAVQREQIEARKQTESMRNELFILHDRVATARTQAARAPSAPPKLEVVKLVPSAPRRAATPAPTPDPLDEEGYDASADEAEMFSFAGDDAAA